jgi:hypothetical protein
LRNSAISLPADAGYFGREFAIRSSTSASHASSNTHQHLRSSAVANVALAEIISQVLLV